MSDANTEQISQPGQTGQEAVPDTGAATGADGHADPSSQAPAGVSSEATPEGYVHGEGYWQGRHVPQDDIGVGYAGEVFAATGVRQDVGGQGIETLYEMARYGESLPEMTTAHSYDLSAFRNDFRAEDQKPLVFFLNRMAAKNASQREIEVMLRMYLDGQQRIAKREARHAAKPEVLRKPVDQMSLEDIRKAMRVDRAAYNRSAEMQARYRALLAAGSN